MFENMDNIEELNGISSDVGKPFELSESQSMYLKELNVPSDVWRDMSAEAREQQLSLIMNRFDEIVIPDDVDKMSLFSTLFNPEMIESYEIIKASDDMVQIEEISDTLADCTDLRFEEWSQLELTEKVDLLNNLECKIAEIEHRPPCPIRAQSMGAYTWGGYNQSTKTIDINSEYINISGYDYETYKEVVDTLVHEGRHAYQDYNIHEVEVHPRHREVESWKETWGDGKWEYTNDCSTMLGQRLYEQQSIEIDARNFAGDVLDKYQQKLNA